MRIIFLGTAGSTPSLTRSLPAISIVRKGELILLDCGEGTQRRMIQAKVGLRRKMKIFITHMHGDHVLGLPGVLQTMSLFNLRTSLQITGPEGIRRFIEVIKEFFNFKFTFPLKVKEVGEGVVCREKEYVVHAVWTEHSVPNLAYALVENDRPGKFYPEKAQSLGIPKGPLWSKLQHGEDVTLPLGRIIKPSQVLGPKRCGRKIVYSGDTRPCENIIRLTKNADLLIYEATFSDQSLEKAKQNMHSTPSQGAKIAKEAGVKRLFLTHISGRYYDMDNFLQEAKKIFPNAQVAEDLTAVNIPYSDYS